MNAWKKGVSGFKVATSKRDEIQEIRALAEKRNLMSYWFSCLTALDAEKMKRLFLFSGS